MTYETVNPADARERIERQPDHVVVDVRTVEEFEQGHIPGAYNVPFAFRGPSGMEPNPEFAEAIERLFPTDAKLVLV